MLAQAASSCLPVCLLLALMATSVNAFVPVTPVLAARTGVGLRAASSRPVRAQTTAMVLKPEYLEGTGGPPAAGQYSAIVLREPA